MKKHFELVNFTCYGMGLATPEELICQAMEKGKKVAGIADFNSVQSYPDLQTLNESSTNFKVLYGVIFYVNPDSDRKPYDQVFIAKDQEGINQIYNLIEAAENGVLSENQIEDSAINHLICGMPLCWDDNSINCFLEGAWRRQKFILVNEFFNFYKKYDDALELCRQQNIFPCASKYPDLKLTDNLPPEFHFETDMSIDEKTFKNYVDAFGVDLAEKIVFDNPEIISDMINPIKSPLPKTEINSIHSFYMKRIKEICRDRITQIYGKNIPVEIENRLNKELDYIDKSNCATDYMLAKSVCDFLNENGHLTYPREVGNACFVAFLLNISKLNPLPAHYRCKCHYFEWGGEKCSAPDLPEKECPICGKQHYLTADGYNIGFNENQNDKPFFTVDISSEANDYIQSINQINIEGNKFYFVKSGLIETLSSKIIEQTMQDYDFDDDNYNERLYNIKQDFTVEKFNYVGIPSEINVPKTVINGQAVCHFDSDDIDFLPHITMTPNESVSLLESLNRTTNISPDSFPINNPSLKRMFRSAYPIYPAECSYDKAVRGIPGFNNDEMLRWLDYNRIDTFAELVAFYALMAQQDFWFDVLKFIIENDEINLCDIPFMYQDLYEYLSENSILKNYVSMIKKYLCSGHDSKYKDEIKHVYDCFFPRRVTDYYLDTESMPTLYSCIQSAFQALIFAAYKKYYPKHFYALSLLQRVFNSVPNSDDLNYKRNSMFDEESTELVKEAISRGIKF